MRPTDYDGLAHSANPTVKAAIAGVGVAYINSFAQDPTSTTPTV